MAAQTEGSLTNWGLRTKIMNITPLILYLCSIDGNFDDDVSERMESIFGDLWRTNQPQKRVVASVFAFLVR